MNFYIHENNNGTATIKTETGVTISHFHCIEWYSITKNEHHNDTWGFEEINL